MLCKSIHSLLNIDISNTYLSVSKLTIKPTVKDYICKKGERAYSRFFFVLNGITKFTFHTPSGEGKSVVAQKNDIVYLPNDIAYTSTWENVNDIDHISIEFIIQDKNMETILLSDEITVIARDEYAVLLSAFTNIYNTWSEGVLGYKLKMRSQFFDLLMHIALAAAKAEYRDANASIYKSILFIENNYLGTISVKELSQMSNLCETAFRMKFKKQIGMTPIEYKNFLKIKKAAELLKSGEYTVTEAAESVNIPDIYYFSKLFKKQYDLPPREYKNLF